MRLIKVGTFTMTEFGDEPPPYAILSHTWEPEGEVTFQDFQRGPEHFRRMRGFSKIEGCSARAFEDGYGWIWLDTCCIDKSSSSELSEAINCMYRWYRESSVCYALLSDLEPLSQWKRDRLKEQQIDETNESQQRFMSCRWFTRGWTLQELIAPSNIKFFARDWSFIGVRSELVNVIHWVTKIPVTVLRGEPPSRWLACQKMSWAAHRKTTRREDRAYCLMGLFEVFMPLLYGEGDRAFHRLQEEILRRTEDYTLLAWTSNPSQLGTQSGFFAASPADFTKLMTSSGDTWEIVRPLFKSREKTTQIHWQDLNASGNKYGRVISGPHDQTTIRDAHSRQFQLEPPTLTSRGLLATLLIKWDSYMTSFAAWIFTAAPISEPEQTTETLAGICVICYPDPSIYTQDSIATIRSRDTITALRYKTDALHCAPLAEVLGEFEPVKVYLNTITTNELLHPVNLGWGGANDQDTDQVEPGGNEGDAIMKDLEQSILFEDVESDSFDIL
ncbi:heterokaryon incompatibility protein-domain-containing protein [Cercophora scortea]|uniref:Heterokaryon incompatibility protein-domain-containing protein n=1 Tax=Cercophora scortea TaxID=314031 RepID=A0AAE0MB17_9PEZI|nr:heterokaryon incompatibility protein-domain-containing protein [Cercophora scortea]